MFNVTIKVKNKTKIHCKILSAILATLIILGENKLIEAFAIIGIMMSAITYTAAEIFETEDKKRIND